MTESRRFQSHGHDSLRLALVGQLNPKTVLPGCLPNLEDVGSLL